MIDIFEEIKEYYSYQECCNIRYLLSDNPMLTEKTIPKDHQKENQIIWFQGERGELTWQDWNVKNYIENDSSVIEVEVHLIAIGKVCYHTTGHF